MRALNLAVPIGWAEILKRTGAEISAGRCFGWAAGLAYYFFLSLFPAALFAVSLAGLLPVQPLIDRIVLMLSRIAPGDVVAIARQQFVQIAQRPNGGVLVISLIAALWSSSSGMAAIVDTLNQAYGITETRSLVARTIDVNRTHTGADVRNAVRVRLVMAGPSAAREVADWLGFGAFFGWWWAIVRWPAAFALVVTALGCIYHFAPDTRHEWVWITPGSVAAASLWLLVSLAFRWYVAHFADYQKTYGAIGGVMVALLWFYCTGLAILIGAQLDATIEQAAQEGQGRQPV